MHSSVRQEWLETCKYLDTEGGGRASANSFIMFGLLYPAKENVPLVGWCLLLLKTHISFKGYASFLMYSLGIDGGERVVEGLDDVMSVPRAGDNGTQRCGKAKNITVNV